MNYFITGATGFIGSQLLQRLAKRPGDIYLLTYDKISEDRLEALLDKHNLPKNKFHCIKGSITEPNLASQLKIPRNSLEQLISSST